MPGFREPPCCVVPIFEYACRKCRRVFSFLARRREPAGTPTCPRCGAKDLTREISRFAMLKGAPEPAAAGAGDPDSPDETGVPDFDDPKIARALGELERDMDHLDEDNPRHLAHLLRKMKDVLPTAGSAQERRDMETAIRRLEAGEDPEKIEADMGDLLGLGDGEGGAAAGGGGGPYAKDSGLYDY